MSGLHNVAAAREAGEERLMVNLHPGCPSLGILETDTLVSILESRIDTS